MKKEKEVIIVLDVEQNYLNQKLNMKVDQVGHLFFKHYQMFLKQKQITTLDMLEQSTIVKNVVDTTVIFLMMDQNLLEKDIVIMEFAWFLNQFKIN